MYSTRYRRVDNVYHIIMSLLHHVQQVQRSGSQQVTRWAMLYLTLEATGEQIRILPARGRPQRCLIMNSGNTYRGSRTNNAPCCLTECKSDGLILRRRKVGPAAQTNHDFAFPLSPAIIVSPSVQGTGRQNSRRISNQRSVSMKVRRSGELVVQCSVRCL